MKKFVTVALIAGLSLTLLTGCVAKARDFPHTLEMETGVSTTVQIKDNVATYYLTFEDTDYTTDDKILLYKSKAEKVIEDFKFSDPSKVVFVFPGGFKASFAEDNSVFLDAFHKAQAYDTRQSTGGVPDLVLPTAPDN